MTSPAPAVTDEEVEAASIVLFDRSDYAIANPGGTLLGPNDFRQDARAALEAAAAVRHASEQQAEALSPWTQVWASSAAGLCMCHACVASRGEMQVTMHLCPKCGNKRCPKAENHDYRCTDSNAVGQVGEPEAPPTAPLAHVADAIRTMPESRRDLDRMSDAIRALPGAPVMGRVIGDGR